MTILCATDFSPSAKQAANVAVGLAAKLGEPLHLVHSIDAQAAEKVLDSGAAEVHAGLTAWLEEEAARLRAQGGTVTTEILAGIPDEQIARNAQTISARLIVVGDVGRRAASDILLGSVAERLCQIASQPVFVVRAQSGLQSWLKGQRSLRVLVAADLEVTGAAAIASLLELQRLGPLQLLITNVSSPEPGVEPDAHRRATETRLREALEAGLGGSIPASLADARTIIEPATGRVDECLVDLAARESADLIVVGSNQRAGLARLWHTSVSRGVVQLATMSVVLVPASMAAD